jgi:hypothetical protein
MQSSSTLLEFGTSSCKFFILSEIFSLRSCEIQDTVSSTSFWMDWLKFRVSDQKKKAMNGHLLTLSAMLCGSVAWPRRALTRGLGAPLPAAPLPFATSCRFMNGGAFSPILPLLTSLDCTCGEEAEQDRFKQTNFGTKSICTKQQSSTETRTTVENLFRIMRRSCCIKRRELLPREVQVMQTAEFLQGRHQVRRTSASWYTLRLCQHRQLTVHLYLMPLPLDGGTTINQ